MIRSHGVIRDMESNHIYISMIFHLARCWTFPLNYHYMCFVNFIFNFRVDPKEKCRAQTMPTSKPTAVYLWSWHPWSWQPWRCSSLLKFDHRATHHHGSTILITMTSHLLVSSQLIRCLQMCCAVPKLPVLTGPDYHNISKYDIDTVLGLG